MQPKLLNVNEFTVLNPRPSINRLCFSSRPNTILGGVIPININTVYRCTCIGFLVCVIRFAHISKKVLKRSPTFTNPNTSTAVVPIIGRVRIITALAKINPSKVNRLPLFARSVVRGKIMRCLAVLTSTSFRPSSNKVCPPSFFRPPAITFKQPYLFRRIWGITKELYRSKRVYFSADSINNNGFVWVSCHVASISQTSLREQECNHG
jgi:hypothetical protein